jgi:RimJ/RimL family protein N-acetyltransferase
MTSHTNKLGQAIGFPVDNWSAVAWPPHSNKAGRFFRLEPLNPDYHAKALYAAFSKDTDNRNWTYLPYGPFINFESFNAWLRGASKGNDPVFHVIIDLKTEQAVGIASYLRINPGDGVIEVGHIHFSPLIQRTSIATEAMFLMMSRVFDELGYRRYEWKCDALNEPSRNAALRLGFRLEGIFRQLTMYKGRNRDTAWYSIIDKDWPSIRSVYEVWLAPSNFDDAGNQKRSLSSFMRV